MLDMKYILSFNPDYCHSIIHLEPTALVLGEVVVMANISNSDVGARNIERTSMNVMNAISAKAIEVSSNMTVANVVQRVSGVTI